MPVAAQHRVGPWGNEGGPAAAKLVKLLPGSHLSPGDSVAHAPLPPRCRQYVTRAPRRVVEHTRMEGILESVDLESVAMQPMDLKDGPHDDLKSSLRQARSRQVNEP